jgi:hypothetical protein
MITVYADLLSLATAPVGEHNANSGIASAEYSTPVLGLFGGLDKLS